MPFLSKIEDSDEPFDFWLRGETFVDEAAFMGYTINRNIKHFYPTTILFYNETETITVAIAQDALDYILDLLAEKNPLAASYKTARTVLNAMKMVLDNKRPPKPRKEDLKVAIDVLEEILNQRTISDQERNRNAQMACICKMLIDSSGFN
jgi:hypothetical protein